VHILHEDVFGVWRGFLKASSECKKQERDIFEEVSKQLPMSKFEPDSQNIEKE